MNTEKPIDEMTPEEYQQWLDSRPPVQISPEQREVISKVWDEIAPERESFSEAELKYWKERFGL